MLSVRTNSLNHQQGMPHALSSDQEKLAAVHASARAQNGIWVGATLTDFARSASNLPSTYAPNIVPDMTNGCGPNCGTPSSRMSKAKMLCSRYL